MGKRPSSSALAVMLWAVLVLGLAWLLGWALTPRSDSSSSHSSAALTPQLLAIDPDRFIGYPVSRGHARTAPPEPVETAQPPARPATGGSGASPEPSPAPDTGPAPSTSSSPELTGETSGAGELTARELPEPWRSLAWCESRFVVDVVSSDGQYHGLFQFLPSTWAAVGGSGLPSQASVSEQLKRAQILQARAGWDQWPACAAELGLL